MSIARLIRVLLVDDHAMVRQGLRSALQAYPNIQVVGEAADGEEAVLCTARIQPAVVVMDINMSKMDGITATQMIKTQHPEIVVIGLSVDLKEYQLHAMRKAGAFDLIRKDNVVAELYGAIQRAMAAIQPVLMLEKTPSSDVAQSDKPPQIESMKEPKI